MLFKDLQDPWVWLVSLAQLVNLVFQVSRVTKVTPVQWDPEEQEDPQVSTVPQVKLDVPEMMVSAVNLDQSAKRVTKVSRDFQVFQE